MKRDFTVLGVGFIIGNLLINLVMQTTNVVNVAIIGIGLLVIIGSRYGLFGRTA